MNRRDFIKQTTWASIGGLLVPSLLLSSCRKDTLFENIGYNGKVLVIGGGAAGLYAGYILKSKGIDFQILEASSVYGGRLGNISGFADFPLDSGAEWLHGNNNILGDLVAKTNTRITLDNSDIYFWYKNQIVSSLPKDIVSTFTKEKNIPDVSFIDYAHQQGYGSDYNNIVEAIAGDSGASADKISAYWKIEEEATWISGDNDYKFQDTYFDFFDTNIASLVKDKVLLNTPVAKIDYSGSSIVVTDKNNQTYTADKVIITVPITILKSNDIAFFPALLPEKTSAFSKIGMEAGLKIFLKFSSAFYNQNILGGSTCGAYADETVGKTGNDNILLAFIMGEQADRLIALGSDSAIINALLQELDTMYSGQASSTYLDAYIQNWATHPYIKGAYSYSTVGMGNARETAAQPVDNKLYFAGEAMNINGDHQTVFGAVETGYREVINILNSVKK